MPIFDLSTDKPIQLSYEGREQPFQVNFYPSATVRLPRYLLFLDLETNSLFGKISSNYLNVPTIIEYAIIIYDRVTDSVVKTIIKEQGSLQCLKDYVVSIWEDIKNAETQYPSLGLIAHNGFNFDFVILRYLAVYFNIPYNNNTLLFDSYDIAKSRITVISNFRNTTLFERYASDLPIGPLDVKKEEAINLMKNAHTAHADTKMMMLWFTRLIDMNKKFHTMRFSDLLVVNSEKIDIINITESDPFEDSD